jgi:HK97 gp10 family phage protein
MSARTDFGIEKALWRSGKDIQAEFNRQTLERNKTGIIYIRRDRIGRRRRHQSSEAGQTAANRTGKYRKAAGFIVNGDELTFGNSADYAGFLETGTSRMKARPGLSNSIKASERDIIRNLSTSISEAL